MNRITFIPSCKNSLALFSILTNNYNKQEVHIQETLLKKETAVKFIERMVKLKADISKGNVLACHKAVFVGRRLVKIPENEDDIRKILKLYSGRNHDVHTAVLLKRKGGEQSLKRTVTRVKVKNLSLTEIDSYVESKLWVGKIGGYTFNSIFEGFVMKIIGSKTGAEGLPLYETKNLLLNAGVI
jgi:septum formation protein